ncbi:hypothetical protein LBMAG42_23830 [Deltaproteobacteria bacterium]|nr:hypothetical protein LBMAG42_23830 [Deltaproteobacteria bacterium]
MAVIGTTAFLPAAHATTLAPLTHDQMVDAADLIVEGTVLSVNTMVDEHGHVWTQARVRVEQSLKGGAAIGKTVLVESAGGVLSDGRAIDVHLAPRYDQEERVLLYLVSRRFGAAYGTVGMMMGKFTIKQNPADGSDMVVRFTLPYAREYDARFLPNPPAAARVSLASMEVAVETRVAEGWDGAPIPGVSAAHLREINKLQPGVK